MAGRTVPWIPGSPSASEPRGGPRSRRHVWGRAPGEARVRGGTCGAAQPVRADAGRLPEGPSDVPDGPGHQDHRCAPLFRRGVPGDARTSVSIEAEGVAGARRNPAAGAERSRARGRSPVRKGCHGMIRSHLRFLCLLGLTVRMG
ncbi:hypothetical protein GCM10009551_047800 [Nocardiopsis tropica]